MEYKYNDEIIIKERSRRNLILDQFLGKYNKYRESKYLKIINRAEDAANRAEDLKLDGMVTRGIYTGIQTASPIYEEIGEEFLKEKIKGFSIGQYGEDLVRIMYKGLSDDRLEKICKGVREILDNVDSELMEAKVAKSIVDIFEFTDDLEDRSLAETFAINELSFLFEKIKNGEEKNFYINEDAYQKREVYREKGIRNKKSWKPECKDILEFAYEYLLININEIRKEFRENFKEEEKEKMVAYYVTTRPDNVLSDFVEMKKRN